MEAPITNQELHQFITANFNDTELVNFCFYYFPEVYNEFTDEMFKSTKVRHLLHYCGTRHMMPNLLANLRQERSAAYQQTFNPQDSIEGEPERSATAPPMGQRTTSIPNEPDNLADKIQAMPVWMQWGGIVVVLMIVLGMGYAIFGGDGADVSSPMTVTIEAETGFIAKVTETRTKMPTNIPELTDTATVKPTGTTAPSPTHTATPKPPTVTPTPAPGIGSTNTRSTDGAVMVYVPAGEFAMGSDNEDSDEQPIHTVTIDEFWIDQTEVTNAQYERCVVDGQCEESYYADNNDFNGVQQPVVGVSWNDADTYCSWVNGRLPTEAEWEYAARGTDSNIYPWGNELPTIDLLNYNGNVGKTTVVSSYSPNGDSWVGASDMAGNVWEWVYDWYDSDYYQSSPSRNPQGAGGGNYRVLRGGAWFNGDSVVRAANRSNNDPDFRNFNIGFRCAQE